MNKENMKKKFNRAASAIKHGAQGALAGVLTTATIIPIMGLAAHGLKYLGDEKLENYSLKNRFETAYHFDTPSEHKYYYSTPVISGYEAEGAREYEYYLASPYATYGAMALGGIASAIAMGGAGLAMAKRRENER